MNNNQETKRFSDVVKCIRVLGTDVTDADLIDSLGGIIETQLRINININKHKSTKNPHGYWPDELLRKKFNILGIKKV
jgi:hypothetical protein